MDLMEITKGKQKMVENQVMMKNKGKRRGQKRSELEKHAMKVVYISTPMRVKTSASKFMKTVQELTGRESDVVRIMESFGGSGMDTWMAVVDDDDHHHHLDHGVEPSLVLDDGSSPSCSSEELVDHHHNKHHFDQGVLGRQHEGSGSFDCNLLFDHQFSFHFDQELGNY
uniref:VQ domain-containing protein n=1 Tax=Opuntia streptacantha TaxID=393608 RepID=A0A7C8YGR5_OPUST